MSTRVAELLEGALQLPDESRWELVEAILEQSQPDPEWLVETVRTACSRREDVLRGKSHLVCADEAHRLALSDLRSIG